ncbi:MAG: Holliday junction branch migration protein RuvA [Nitrospirota bacterium]|nr:MAG: Holliday junction branch migration protein RuvA [Nitrospirota bacterium]
MIAGLKGRLIRKSPSQAILDVNGVAYDIHISLSTYFQLPKLQEFATLQISTQLRNESIQLFGFLTLQEKETFTLLTGITGIGPKLALSILSTLSVNDLLSSIQSNDIDRLSSVPGIGRKSASRITLEMKDKINRLQSVDMPPGEPPNKFLSNELEEDAASALLNLGYRSTEVKKAIQRSLQNNQEEWSLENLIRESLKELAKG